MRIASGIGLSVVLGLLFTSSTALAEGAFDWATAPSEYDANAERDWGVEVVPYLWLASLNGEVALPATPSIPVGVTFSDLATNLNGGFAGLLDARWRRWHLISDNMWVSLNSSPSPSAGPVTSADVDLTVAFGTVALAYELPVFEEVALDAYMGARWWLVGVDASLTTGGPGSPIQEDISPVWASFVVGTRARYRINDRWRVNAQFDIGGAEASLDWSLMGGVGYDFNQHVGVTAAYRVLGVNFSRDGFKYDVTQHGLLLGVNLRY